MCDFQTLKYSIKSEKQWIDLSCYICIGIDYILQNVTTMSYSWLFLYISKVIRGLCWKIDYLSDITGQIVTNYSET